MDRLFPAEVDVKSVGPVTLAFIGDAVYDLMVREMLLSKADRSSGDLHRMKVRIVRAEAQARAINDILNRLSEKELAVYKRGRNAKTFRSGGDYHAATGFEALMGYLYLDGQIDRVRELFALIHGNFQGE